MTKQKRFKFSIVRNNGRYYVQCDDTGEIMSGAISQKRKALKYLLDHVNTDRFLQTLPNMSKEEVARRVKIFGGRLRPKKKPWTLEEARLIASLCDSRGELYTEYNSTYMTAYNRGWLDDICKGMKPSRKKNKFIFGVLSPNAALSKIFDYKSHSDFTRDNHRAYDLLRRFDVDTVELFDNLDNVEYLKNVIRKLGEINAEKFVNPVGN
jgi:hypothetical protein